MDPNQSTVRSIAELLVDAEEEDYCESAFTNQCYTDPHEAPKSELSSKSAEPQIQITITEASPPPSECLDALSQRSTPNSSIQGTPPPSPHSSPEPERRSAASPPGSPPASPTGKNTYSSVNNNGSTHGHHKEPDEGELKQIKVVLPDGTKKDVTVWSGPTKTDDEKTPRRGSQLTRNPTIIEIKNARNRTFSIRSQLSALSRDDRPKPRQRSLKIGVGVMFALLVLLLIIVYALHYRDLGIRRGKVNINIDPEHRLFWITEQSGMVGIEEAVFSTVLGVKFPWQVQAYDCSEDYTREDHVCLRWQELGELRIQFEDLGDLRAYHFHWIAYSDSVVLQDCISVHGDVYGGGLMRDQPWPLHRSNVPIHMAFVTGSGPSSLTGPVLQPVWVTSRSVAIRVQEEVPLFVAIGNRTVIPQSILDVHLEPYADDDMDMYYGEEGDNYFCLGADAKRDPFDLQDGAVAELNYTLYLGKNMSHALQHVMSAVVEDSCLLSVMNETCSTVLPNCTADNSSEPCSAHSHSTADLQHCFSQVRNVNCSKPDLSLLDAPLWSTFPFLGKSFSSDDVTLFIGQINKHGFPASILFSPGWEANIGDLTFNPGGFTNITQLVKYLHELGIQSWLTVHPFVGVNSHRFNEGLGSGYFMYDGGARAPGLVPFTLGNSTDYVAVTDIVQSGSAWWHAALADLRSTTGLENFLVLGGDIGSLPYDAHFESHYTNPNQYTSSFQEFVSQFGHQVITSSAFGRSPPLTWIKLSDLESSWGDLQKVVPQVLSASMSGYPFLIPSVIGGTSAMTEPELYIRWAQLSAFLPVMHFSTPPGAYDNTTQDIVSNALRLHQTVVLPVIRRLAENYDMIPPTVIAPLWYVDQSSSVLKVNEQFLIGDEILVAPVVKKGIRQMHIYVPKGKWRDPVSSLILKGPSWIEYSVLPTTIPYFIRYPEK